MKNKVTLEYLAELIKGSDSNINTLSRKTDARFEGLESRIEGLTEVIIKRFEDIDGSFRETKESLEQIKFNTSGQERRISILEDKVRLIGTKIGLNYKN